MISTHGLSLIIVGLSAACGLIVEIVAGRMIAPYLGMSLYTWTAIIAVVLAGFSLGHWLGGLLAERPRRQALRGVAWSLLLAAVSTAATLVVIRLALPAIIAIDAGAVATVLMATMVLFFLPSLFVGVPSPVLTKLAIEADVPTRTGRTIGAFYAVGAIGSIAGTLAAGFVFIAWLGTSATLIVVAVLYLVMALALFLRSGGDGLRSLGLPLVFVLAAAILIGGVGQTIGAFRSACQVESSYYCIRVVDISAEAGEPAKVMILDHLGHGINLRDAPERLVSPYVELTDMLARLHTGRRSPLRAFFVGGGAYTLPRAWLGVRPDAQITVAEIDPAVTRIAHNEMWLAPSERLKSVHLDARVALVRESPARLDVIVGDAFHDIVVPPHLVTSEFFELVASRLRSDGIYVMNVVDSGTAPRLALSILAAMAPHFEVTEIWQVSAPGERATFVLAGLSKATPQPALPSQVAAGLVFERLGRQRLEHLRARLEPIMLSDDYAPADRLIGIE